MPARASAIRLENSSSVKGLPSAVPWISTMPPEPVMTRDEAMRLAPCPSRDVDVSRTAELAEATAKDPIVGVFLF